jgi:RHS repeat-associated protein
MYIPGESGIIAQATQAQGAAAPTVEYLHGDHQGSVNAISAVGGANGTTVQVRFDPFGTRIGTSNPPVPISSPQSPVADVTLGFTGHEEDDEVALINMNGRMYDPALSRFLTSDPLVSRSWKSQSFNRYAYVENSPLRFVDPSGLSGTDDDAKDDKKGKDDKKDDKQAPTEKSSHTTYNASTGQYTMTLPPITVMVFSPTTITGSPGGAQSTGNGATGQGGAAPAAAGQGAPHAPAAPAAPSHGGSAHPASAGGQASSGNTNPGASSGPSVTVSADDSGPGQSAGGERGGPASWTDPAGVAAGVVSKAAENTPVTLSWPIKGADGVPSWTTTWSELDEYQPLRDFLLGEKGVGAGMNGTGALKAAEGVKAADPLLTYISAAIAANNAYAANARGDSHEAALSELELMVTLQAAALAAIGYGGVGTLGLVVLAEFKMEMNNAAATGTYSPTTGVHSPYEMPR